jgi:hypothetical protein
MVTVPFEGTVTETFWVPPITKFGKVDGVKTGVLSRSAEGAAIVTAVDASENALSPTRFVALTLTV